MEAAATSSSPPLEELEWFHAVNSRAALAASLLSAAKGRRPFALEVDVRVACGGVVVILSHDPVADDDDEGDAQQQPHFTWAEFTQQLAADLPATTTTAAVCVLKLDVKDSRAVAPLLADLERARPNCGWRSRVQHLWFNADVVAGPIAVAVAATTGPFAFVADDATTVPALRRALALGCGLSLGWCTVAASRVPYDADCAARMLALLRDVFAEAAAPLPLSVTLTFAVRCSLVFADCGGGAAVAALRGLLADAARLVRERCSSPSTPRVFLTFWRGRDERIDRACDVPAIREHFPGSTIDES